jgi:wyosine [tRNA(Phe)-imidazoG37] synthetase (radical SAM superfamily)
MENPVEREHDFGAKLKQVSVVKRLQDYVCWQRNVKTHSEEAPPDFGPVSINLDLTQACNFSCPYCVDSSIINSGKSFDLEMIKETLAILHAKGLLSVILLGGGEPTLHKDFVAVVQEVKKRQLQVGIVTNGTKLDRVAKVVGLLNEKDWIRISLDAAREETFRALHRPKTKVTLKRILGQAQKIKQKNSQVSLGYSFVIIWNGVQFQGKELPSNLDEMSEAVTLAREHSFDYVSFKPCLVRLESSQRESLLDHVDENQERTIVEAIRGRLEEAKKAATGQIKILESINLKAMLNYETGTIKKQPRRCHMQFFRTVVTPIGIFHCPAFRGVDKGKISGEDGYASDSKFDESLVRTGVLIQTFDAEEECREVGCFYHPTNWWIEELIRSGTDIREIAPVEDDNFFL